MAGVVDPAGDLIWIEADEPPPLDVGDALVGDQTAM
jgi:hypothetical protein